MSHQFVGLLGGRIEAHRRIHLVSRRERLLIVAAIHAAGAGVYQMLHLLTAAILQNVGKAHNVAVHIRHRIVQGITHAGLSPQVAHHLDVVQVKQSLEVFRIFQIQLNKRCFFNVTAHNQLIVLNFLLGNTPVGQTGILEPLVVIIIDVVRGNDEPIVHSQPTNQVITNKTSRTGDKNATSSLVTGIPHNHTVYQSSCPLFLLSLYI